MTLSQLFELISENPAPIIFFSLAIILTSFLAGVFSNDEGHLSPWTYLYSTLIYLVCIPGIFSITLNLYTFIFERRSIYDLNVYIHILPIITMFITLAIIRRNVDFKYIPGFDRISALITIITIILVLLWLLEKTHIFVISFLPFQYVFLIIIALLFFLRLGFKKLF